MVVIVQDGKDRYQFSGRLAQIVRWLALCSERVTEPAKSIKRRKTGRQVLMVRSLR